MPRNTPKTTAAASAARRRWCRRTLSLTLSALAGAWATPGPAAEAEEDAAPSLRVMLQHPLLVSSLYRLPVTHAYGADGAAGANQDGYRWIEEQRQGAEWLVRGLAEQRSDWQELGWRQLDWGLARQLPDGSFGSQDAFHSTSFFVEALARSCLLDPAQASAARRSRLASAARWLTSAQAEAKGVSNNRPYTHRRYILAAACGQAATVCADEWLHARAAQWAREGIALQAADGCNPEKGGFDAGYQMVGALMALRYLPVCRDRTLRAQLRQMLRRAVALELERQQADGAIDATGSTRIEIEQSRSGKIKSVPYGEIMQALVYGAQAVPQPSWLAAAQRIALRQKWLRA